MSSSPLHVTAHSKEVKPGSVFFALKGAQFDGHDYIEEAFKAGALMVYSENPVSDPRVIVLGTQARKKLAELASEMVNHPTRELVMVGVTGTSGKTTTSYLIQHLLKSKYRCARLGTNGAEFEGTTWETLNTTPDAITLQKWFREVRDLGATHVVMEASSHALDQDRAWAIAWDAAVFLNLSPEHMDYHPTMDHYFEAKSKLFLDHFDYSRSQGKTPQGFTNLDADYGKKLLEKDSRLLGYSIQKETRNFTNISSGLSAEIKIGSEWRKMECPLFGSFQLENILAAMKIAAALGIDNVWDFLKTFRGVPGRMESISNSRGFHIFVDYAHKPEALEKVLCSIQGQPIITVFGCGGDRDRTKRPVMGAIATRLSKHVIVTNDNPRTEDPFRITAEIEAGILQAGQSNYEIISDREQAIYKAISIARRGDIVLIAGKGHETYQIISNHAGGTIKIHFDDREIARRALY